MLDFTSTQMVLTDWGGHDMGKVLLTVCEAAILLTCIKGCKHLVISTYFFSFFLALGGDLTW